MRGYRHADEFAALVSPHVRAVCGALRAQGWRFGGFADLVAARGDGADIRAVGADIRADDAGTGGTGGHLAGHADAPPDTPPAGVPPCLRGNAAAGRTTDHRDGP